jgi:hypothetical protein
MGHLSYPYPMDRFKELEPLLKQWFFAYESNYKDRESTELKRGYGQLFIATSLRSFWTLRPPQPLQSPSLVAQILALPFIPNCSATISAIWKAN